MRWIMDVVTLCRESSNGPLIIGIPLFDVQKTLNLLKEELRDCDDSDELLFHIPAISLSTPTDYGPKINIQSECNSTPSSPPATIEPPPSAFLERRKSRDDSYLEEHHRMQNHFNSVHHHRFRHQYSCSHQSSLHFHSDSLESSHELDQITSRTGVGNDSLKNDLHLIDTMMEATGDHSSGGSSEPPEDQPTIGRNACSKSSVSLLDSVQFMSTDQRGSLTVDKTELEDMRRCVSASRLATSSNDSPNFCCFQTPPSTNSNESAGHHGRTESYSNSTNYFFAGDIEILGHDDGIIHVQQKPCKRSSKIAVITSPPPLCDCKDLTDLLPYKLPEMLHHSNQSIDSLSDISFNCLGGEICDNNTVDDIATITTTTIATSSQLSMGSQVQMLPYDQDIRNSDSNTLINLSSGMMYSPAPSSRIMEFTENYRPLSRAFMFSSEAIEQDLILEEEEDELPTAENDHANDAHLPLLNYDNIQSPQSNKRIPEVKIWSNLSEDSANEVNKCSGSVNEEGNSNDNLFLDNFVISPLLADSSINSSNLYSLEESAYSEEIKITTTTTFDLSATSRQKPSSSPSILLLASSPTPLTSTIIPTTAIATTTQAPTTQELLVKPENLESSNFSVQCANVSSSQVHSFQSYPFFFKDNFGDILLQDNLSNELNNNNNNVNVNNLSEFCEKLIKCEHLPNSSPAQAQYEATVTGIRTLDIDVKPSVSCDKKAKEEEVSSEESSIDPNHHKQPYHKAHRRRTVKIIKLVYFPKKIYKTSNKSSIKIHENNNNNGDKYCQLQQHHSHLYHHDLYSEPFEIILNKFERPLKKFGNNSKDKRKVNVNNNKKVKNNKKNKKKNKTKKSCCPYCCCHKVQSSSSSTISKCSVNDDLSESDSFGSKSSNDNDDDDEDDDNPDDHDERKRMLLAKEKEIRNEEEKRNEKKEANIFHPSSVAVNIGRRRTHKLQHRLHKDSVRRMRRESPGSSAVATSTTTINNNLQQQINTTQTQLITLHIAYKCGVLPFRTMIILQVSKQTVVSEIVETIALLEQLDSTTNLTKDLTTDKTTIECCDENGLGERQQQQHTHQHQYQQQQLNDQRQQLLLLKQKLQMFKRHKKENSANREKLLSSKVDLCEDCLSRYSLLVKHASSIKHLDWNFPILSLQPPWNEAKLCLMYYNGNITPP